MDFLLTSTRGKADGDEVFAPRQGRASSPSIAILFRHGPCSPSVGKVLIFMGSLLSIAGAEDQSTRASSPLDRKASRRDDSLSGRLCYGRIEDTLPLLIRDCGVLPKKIACP
jgi:hypothetical protein